MRRYLSSPPRVLLALGFIAVSAMILACLGSYQYLHPSLPDVTTIKDIRLRVPLRVYSRDGRLIAQFGEERRIPLAFDAIPNQMINAVLAAEDDNFFQHGGVDYPGLGRATARHLLSGEKAEGGSTITMQLARGLFLSPEKSYRRKLIEIFTTFRIEQELTKQEILALYLNKMFLGQRAYGVGAAAEVYFGKTVEQLKLPEIALIAGTFRLPSRDNPVANADLAKQRRSYVLRRMREKEFITQDEYDIALNAPVESRLHGPTVEVDAPYVAEMARVELFNRLGAEAYTAGYEAVTTLDSRLQGASVRALRAALIEYDQRHGYRGPAGRVTLAAGAREKEFAQALEDYLAARRTRTGADSFSGREECGCVHARQRPNQSGVARDQLGARAAAGRQRRTAAATRCGRARAERRRLRWPGDLGELAHAAGPGHPGRAGRGRSARTARSPRSAAASTTSRATTTARCRRDVSRVPRSSRSCIPRRSNRASRRRASSTTRRW